jgi:hypothetical protein
MGILLTTGEEVPTVSVTGKLRSILFHPPVCLPSPFGGLSFKLLFPEACLDQLLLVFVLGKLYLQLDISIRHSPLVSQSPLMRLRHLLFNPLTPTLMNILMLQLARSLVVSSDRCRQSLCISISNFVLSSSTLLISAARRFQNQQLTLSSSSSSLLPRPLPSQLPISTPAWSARLQFGR